MIITLKQSIPIYLDGFCIDVGISFQVFGALCFFPRMYGYENYSVICSYLVFVLKGNKGAVGVSFMFNGTSFGFVNCHLTSGNEKITRYYSSNLNTIQIHCIWFSSWVLLMLLTSAGGTRTTWISYACCRSETNS